jgi:hypothetical protein
MQRWSDVGRFVLEQGNEKPTSRPLAPLRSPIGSTPHVASRDDVDADARAAARKKPTLETAAMRVTPVPEAPHVASPGAALKVALASLPPRGLTATPTGNVPDAVGATIEEQRRARAERATRETAPMTRVVARESDYPEITIEPSARPVRELRPASRHNQSGVHVRGGVVETTNLRTGTDPRRER